MSIAVFDVDEDGSAVCLARVTKEDASHNMVIATTADFSSITRTVYDEAGTVVIGPDAMTINSSLILAAYSTGNIWNNYDSTGFNFENTIPATAFPEPDRLYLVVYKLTFTGGSPIVYVKGHARPRTTPGS